MIQTTPNQTFTAIRNDFQSSKMYSRWLGSLRDRSDNMLDDLNNYKKVL